MAICLPTNVLSVDTVLFVSAQSVDGMVSEDLLDAIAVVPARNTMVPGTGQI